MPAKSLEQKNLEKQMKLQEKVARDAKIRDRATGIVAGSHQENGFRIMDAESEALLREILKQYNGNESNRVSFSTENIPASLKENSAVLYEALQMYGMIASPIAGVRSAILTITESAKNYFESKSNALSESMKMDKPVKIFISHSSKDVEYVRRIVEFLEDMNVPEEGIFCSSIPEYGIPGGQKIFDFLREQFETYNLHMIFVLSENYYNSVASMNEMGAAWVGRNDYTVVLLPKFPYSGIKGVLDPQEIATKIDDEETIGIRLSELRDKVLSEFGLNKMNENKWERVRNSFISNMLNIVSQKNEENTEDKVLSTDATRLILELAEDSTGRLVIINDLSGTAIMVGNHKFNNETPRDTARWEKAVDELSSYGYIEIVNESCGDKIYKILKNGFEYADLHKI